jgi:outer membrane receptor protein involved in Fe transport
MGTSRGLVAGRGLVVTGAFDTYAASVGSAAVDPGVVSLACGTWNSFNMAVRPGWPVALVHDGIGVYPHPGPTGFGLLVTNPNGMAVIDWARHLLHLSVGDLEAGLAAAGRGPGRVFADAVLPPLPHVKATPGFGGTFSGVTLAATAVDLVRALLEGIACEFSLTLDLFGNVSNRDDRRTRLGADERTFTSSGSAQSYREDNRIVMLPEVHVGTLGLSFRPDSKNALELSGEHFKRRPTRDGLSTIVSRGSGGAIVSDFDRRQTGYESEGETGVTGAFEHDFAKEDHTLRLEASASDNPQTEAAYFVEHWRTPAKPDPANNVVLRQAEHQGQLSLDYANPVSEDSKLEAGYALELHRQDIRSDAESLDVVQGTFLADPARTYRFRLDQAIHAVYGTYQRSMGKLSMLGGLRGEYSTVTSDLVTGGLPFTDTYYGLYPTLHMAYQATARGQVQLNYSRRIRRPESDDLNPFPEYTDPYNIDSGNPRLKPESIHSFELGYRLRAERFSFEPTIYYRDRRNGFTRVTQAINDSTFLRTMANLASDRSAGLEPVLTLSLSRTLQANLNGNVFYDQIDASNIGYSSKRSVVSWSGTFRVTVTPRTATMVELSSSYRSTRLTPQGDSRPSFVLNMGARQNLYRDQFSLTLAVSDLLKTQRQDTQLDVSGIQQEVRNRRDSQVVYVGLTYHYGRPEKSDKKDKPIQYEDQP